MGQMQKTERKEKKKERLNDGIATPPRVAHAKPPGPMENRETIFTHRSFPEVGQKQKTERKEKGKTEQ